MRETVLVSLVLVCLLELPQAPSKAPSKKTAASALTDPCENARQAAFSDGWKEGARAQRSALVTSIGNDAKILPVRIEIADFDGADSYRFAAAEVVRTHFAEQLRVATDAQLVLAITGTGLTSSTSSGPQYVAVEMMVPIRHFIDVDDETHGLDGTLVLKHDGWVFSGHERERSIDDLLQLQVRETKQCRTMSNSGELRSWVLAYSR